ncbi:HAMP domain-containing sensor histidine kinase [Photobacterium leiognathi subsp. mandapamensis]|uniref:sensor histidine kinase n=1 Tax=Photobacterium leiognathi TaxID=553611 RepID=UPI002981F1B0|nr:HAMP domain-containing sensor histidine kinase [Photobacterium leiognathi]
MDKVTASKLKHYPSIYRKVGLSVSFMAFSMFVLFWIVIYIAENQLEVISLHHWLDKESTQYVIDYDKMGEQAPLPNNSEFKSYWSLKSLPEWLAPYNKPGFYEHLRGTEDKHFIVFKHPSGKGLMYVVYQDDADDYLDDYEDSLHYFTFIFGVLLSLIMGAYSFYFIRSLSHPFAQIENKIGQMQPSHNEFSIDTQYKETREIEQALLDSKREIANYFQREKEFSRFASHELRTPIMIIQGSADLLDKVPNQPNVAKKAIKRLHQASDEMKILTETFLLLGKHEIEPHHLVTCHLADELEKQLQIMSPLFAKQDTHYQLSISNPCTVTAPLSFITIIINNLIKNAFSYSVGDIMIELNEDTLKIVNRHDGNETYNQGYGCGLVIVQRICERMHWPFNISNDYVNFNVKVEFSSPTN